MLWCSGSLLEAMKRTDACSTVQVWVIGKRERESTSLPLGGYNQKLGFGRTGCFLKVTHQLSKFLQALDRVHPPVRWTGLYSPAPHPKPPNNLVPVLEEGRKD